MGSRKVAIVTGGSRGIGAATARLAAARGYAVCVNYRTRRDARLQRRFLDLVDGAAGPRTGPLALAGAPGTRVPSAGGRATPERIARPGRSRSGPRPR